MGTRKGRSLEVAGLSHGHAPIPMGARVGNVIFSSGIFGKDPAAEGFSERIEEQMRWAFRNMETLLADGEATIQDVVRMTVYLRDESARAALNEEWLRYFPDPADRPARHTVIHDLRGGMQVQIEIVAVIS